MGITMKLISIVMIAGLILLYFVSAAFKIQIMSWEMLVHSILRFLTGFILIGVSVLYAHKLRLRSAVFLVLVLVLADDVVDYFRNVDSFSFENTLHGIYMLLWGSLMGYLFMDYSKNKIDRP
jgi:FtsH-binding integral membrane protein